MPQIQELYTLRDAKIAKETDAAILVIEPATGEQIWIPLSQVDRISRKPNSDEADISMTIWIAKKKGLL